MTENPLQQFVLFVEHDQHIGSVKKKIDALNAQIAEIDKQNDMYAKVVVDLQHVFLQAQKDVDVQEKLLKELDQRAKAIKKKLEESVSNKETVTLSKQLEGIHHDQQQQEEKVVAAWRIVEKSEQQHAQALEKAQGAQKELQENKDQLSALLGNETQAYNTLLAQREEKVANVQQEWYQKYERMLQFVDDPVVIVAHGVCSACSHTITQQDLIRLEKRALIECKGCFRLLYLPVRLNV